MLTPDQIETAYSKALSKVSKKPLTCSRVFYGLYLASDSNGRIWQVSHQIESPGRPWMAQSYPVSHHSDYTDHFSTKADVLYDLGFE